MLVEAFIAQPATRRAPLHQARHTLPFRPNNLFNSLKDAQIVIESGASATTSGVRILRSAIVRRRRRPSHPEEARLWHEPVQYKVSHSCWYQNVRPVPSSSGIGLKAKDRREPALRGCRCPSKRGSRRESEASARNSVSRRYWTIRREHRPCQGTLRCDLILRSSVQKSSSDFGVSTDWIRRKKRQRS